MYSQGSDRSWHKMTNLEQLEYQLFQIQGSNIQHMLKNNGILAYGWYIV